MFFDPACVPCIINQAYNSAKLFTDGDKELQFKIIKEVCNEVQNILMKTQAHRCLQKKHN